MEWPIKSLVKTRLFFFGFARCPKRVFKGWGTAPVIALDVHGFRLDDGPGAKGRSLAVKVLAKSPMPLNEDIQNGLVQIVLSLRPHTFFNLSADRQA